MNDENIRAVNTKRLLRTKSALEKNGMECFIADTAADVLPIVRSLLTEGCTVASGGSMSLIQTGVIDLLRNGNYNYLDRSGLKGDALKKCYRESFGADVYLCSSNAVTEDGDLLNVDGNGNRTAAICYGPDSVVMVVGINKIVPDLNDAFKRIKEFSAPANTRRLECDTYCLEKGECMAFASGDSRMTAGCRSEQRICCDYVITSFQKNKGRIKVILVAEELGY